MKNIAFCFVGACQDDVRKDKITVSLMMSRVWHFLEENGTIVDGDRVSYAIFTGCETSFEKAAHEYGRELKLRVRSIEPTKDIVTLTTSPVIKRVCMCSFSDNDDYDGLFTIEFIRQSMTSGLWNGRLDSCSHAKPSDLMIRGRDGTLHYFTPGRYKELVYKLRDYVKNLANEYDELVEETSDRNGFWEIAMSDMYQHILALSVMFCDWDFNAEIENEIREFDKNHGITHF